MKHFQIIFFVFSMIIGMPLVGFEVPPKPNQPGTTQAQFQKRFHGFPSELRTEVLYYNVYSLYPNIPAMSERLVALKDKITAQGLLAFVKSLPYTANGLDLIQYLRDANISIANDPTITAWFNEAKKNLSKGRELFDAALHQDIRKITELLSNPNLNLNYQAETNNGTTSLESAIFLLYMILSDKEIPIKIKVIDMLLNAGANPNIKSNRGEAPLSHIVNIANTSVAIKVLNSLLKKGANPNIIIKDETPLLFLTKRLVEPDIASKLFSDYESRLAKIEMIKSLLAFGADPNLKDKSGKSARDYASKYKHPELIKLFKEREKRGEAEDRTVEPILRPNATPYEILGIAPGASKDEI